MKNTILGKPLEFGNHEQIKFLKKSEEDMQEMVDRGIATNDERIKLKGEITYRISFNCFQCGQNVSLYDAEDIDDYESIHDAIEEVELKCQGCKCEYVIENGIILLTENPVRPDLITRIEHQL